MPIILPDSVKNARKQIRTAPSIKHARSVNVAYRKSLLTLTGLLKAQTKLIKDAVKVGGTPSQLALLIQEQLDIAQSQFDQSSAPFSIRFIQQSNNTNREKVEAMVKTSLGVDFARVVDTPEIAEALDFAVFNNVNLIKTIPQNHFGRVTQAVTNNFQGLETDGKSLAERLQEIGGITDTRAKFIARDQTAKLSTELTKVRNQSIGIEEYVWRNSQDNRVVGNPGGKYPKGHAGHLDHWHREGKIYRYDSPPADGNPGQAFNCRCTGEPIIDLDKLNAQFL